MNNYVVVINLPSFLLTWYLIKEIKQKPSQFTQKQLVLSYRSILQINNILML